MSSLSDFDGGEPVYRFSRARAIADGLLADVSRLFPDQVAAAGIAVPVAMTTAAFAAAIGPISDRDGDAGDVLTKELIAAGESIYERARRVLHAYAHSVGRLRLHASGALFAIAVTVLHAPGDWREVDLWFICSKGDDGEHVLTVTLPDEEMSM